jgi:hypothetical protein
MYIRMHGTKYNIVIIKLDNYIECTNQILVN